MATASNLEEIAGHRPQKGRELRFVAETGTAGKITDLKRPKISDNCF